MSRLRTQENSEISKNSETYKTRSKKHLLNRFAGEFLKERLSKYPSVGVEDADKEQP